MLGDPQVEVLLERLLESGGTPEEVCREHPEMLPQILKRWQILQACNAQLDELFPTGLATCYDTELTLNPGADLPLISGYEVETVLGRGGMGIVFRARHLRLNRIVALKMVLTGAYASPRERDRFQREAEAVAALRHTNIVQVYDVGDADGRPYYTMEYVEGGSLSQKLAGTPQPSRLAAMLVATLAGAAQAAHRGGIVHRDLKPANILLMADGTPKISDFGLARRFGAEAGLTRTGTVLGTPSYMAPEQASGESLAVGPVVDIYALGAILYELLTGRPPFRAETAAETVQQLISQDPVPPSRLNGKVPRDLETICLKCLHKEPQKRYDSATGLEKDLQCFLQGEPITARPESRFERYARRIRRRPALSAAVAIAAMLAVALVGGGLWFISERSAATRVAGADLAATERAADEDLNDMVRSMKKCSWIEAGAALERARARLANRGSTDFLRRSEQGQHDLELVVRFEAIRLNCQTRVGGYLDFTPAAEKYEEEFRESGLGQVHDKPEVVALRVRASHIRNVLVAVLDHWSTCTKDTIRQGWLLQVAALADHDPKLDPTGWRTRARDLKFRKDDVAFARLLDSAPDTDQSAALFVALALHWRARGHNAVPFLKRVHKAYRGDFWLNHYLGCMSAEQNNHAEAIGYFQAAIVMRPGAAIVYNSLGMSLCNCGRSEEGIEHFRQALKLDPTALEIQYNLAINLMTKGPYDEAIKEIQMALRSFPSAAILHTALGYSLDKKNRFIEALDEHQQAVKLEPKRTEAQRELRNFLIRQGRMEEARNAWQKALDEKPTEHDAWYGYAELCLFLGEEDEYRKARKVLLANFGGTTNPHVAERTGRACLLLPATEDELRQVVALAEVALANKQPKYWAVYPSFEFVHGLAEYRQGRFDSAITVMQGAASRVLGPAPRLVIAMALYRKGQTSEARKTLASAVLAYDWRATQAYDQDGWICHALRREAESLILPTPTR